MTVQANEPQVEASPPMAAALHKVALRIVGARTAGMGQADGRQPGVLTSVPYKVHSSNVDSATTRCGVLSIGKRQRTGSRLAEKSSEG